MSKLRFSTAISTQTFANYIEARAKAFKASNGFGRWLEEYKRMDAEGLFEPKKLTELYRDTVNKRCKLGFIQRQAIYYIGTLALEDTINSLEANSFDVWIEELNEPYLDEDGDALSELDFLEAMQLACTINADLPEHEVCVVYNKSKRVAWKQTL